MTTLLDYAEAEGKENLRGHNAEATNLEKASSGTLTILLAITSAGLGYCFKFTPREFTSPLFISLASVLIYLLSITIILVLKCLIVGEFPSVANEPLNLYQKEYLADQIREVELKNVQARIEEAKKKNAKTAGWLNSVRLLAALAPLFMGLIFILVVVVEHLF